MENPLLQNAIESARLGFYGDAQKLLLQVIRQDPNNALAWLWLAQTLNDPKRQADCLRQALRVEPDNPDALAGVEALRNGMPLPEPGGGVVTEPEPELPEAGEMFGWGVLYAEEAEPAPEPEPEPVAPADTFGWGQLYTAEPEAAPPPAPEPEPDTAEDMFGWGDLFVAKLEPEPEPPAVEAPTPVKPVMPSVAFIGMEEEEPQPEPQPTVPEPAPPPAESFLQRARRLRTQGFAPPAPAPESATPSAVLTEPPGSGVFVSPFTVPVSPEAGPVSPEPEAAIAEALPAAAARKFRIFDGRVLFSILGLILLPVLAGMLVWYFFLRGPAVVEPEAESQPVAGVLLRPAMAACRALRLEDFTSVEALGGELTTDTVFTGTQVLITETLVVPAGVRLLLYPGATLVFTPGTSLDVYGTLHACGNKDAPVTFTAFDKTPGGWEGIRLYNPTETTVLSYAVIEYAGDRALYLDKSVPVLADITIARGALFPLSFDGSAVPDLSDNVNLTENPVHGIEVRPGTLSAPDIVWPNRNVPYVVSGLLRVGADTTLDIRSGVIVKFWHIPKGQLPGIWVQGLLKADGVMFTSLHDSSVEAGGVTYLEAIDPQPGDWGSLTFFESSAKSYLRNVTLRYGGRSKAVVTMQGSSPELTQVTITDAAGYPLSADANAFPTLNNLTLSNNVGGNVLELFGDITITGPGTRVWERLGGETPIVRVVRGTLTVGPEAKLIVHPGVVVKFAEHGCLVVRGALSAVGNNAPEEQIIFTSLYDDEYGGDTTGGALVPRDKRGWGGIVLERSDVASEFHYVQVRYATLTLQDTSPTIYNSQIAFAPGPAMRMTPDSSPDLRATSFQDNALQGVTIVTGTLTGERRWVQFKSDDGQIPRILEGEVEVGPGAFLTIDAGATIKADSAGKLTVRGHLYAAGQADQQVTFTSLHDDAWGGDTDRVWGSAHAGDWPGIEIAPEGFVRLAYVGIYYAQTGLTVLGQQLPAIENGRIHIAYSKRPLTCVARAQISPAFHFENNEVDVTRCPSP
ncbi:MAG: tetratricopeptide repeat protein [Anaerolineae bacterium]